MEVSASSANSRKAMSDPGILDFEASACARLGQSGEAPK